MKKIDKWYWICQFKPWQLMNHLSLQYNSCSVRSGSDGHFKGEQIFPKDREYFSIRLKIVVYCWIYFNFSISCVRSPLTCRGSQGMSQCQMSGRDHPVRRSSCTSLELDTRQTVNIAGPGTVSRCHFLTLLSPYYHFLTLLSHLLSHLTLCTINYHTALSSQSRPCSHLSLQRGSSNV